MKSEIFISLISCVALAAPAPLMAQGRGGGHGVGGAGISMGGGLGAGMGGMGGMGAGGRMDGGVGASSGIGRDAIHGRGSVDTGISTRATAREDSQGPVHASDRALERANANSVLSGSTGVGGSLMGLRTGLTVRDTTGAAIGTVTRVNRSSDGTVRSVIVSSDSGRHRTVRLAPESLSVSGDVVTTTKLATSIKGR